MGHVSNNNDKRERGECEGERESCDRVFWKYDSHKDSMELRSIQNDRFFSSLTTSSFSYIMFCS